MSEAQEKPFDLFVSYAEADRAWVEGYLLDGLRTAGVGCLTQGGFQLGASWTEEFERAVAQCSRVLLVLSRAYRADVNQRFLDQVARYHELRGEMTSVIPLLLEAVDLPLGLEAKVGLAAVTEEEKALALERLTRECKGAPKAAKKLSCPYPGMAPFGREDAPRFHGRRREVEEILQVLRHRSCLFLIGPSGSGKSSLVLAGLLPELEKGRAVCVMRPGKTPATTLASLTEGLAPPCLLVVDQFEEVFTAAESEEATRFQAALHAWVNSPDNLLLVTVRSDFYADLQRLPILFPLFEANHRSVFTLGREALREAILEPAATVGVFVEPALVERLIVEAAGEPGLLPHVQETLQLLWKRRRRRRLPLEAYLELGSGGQTGLQQAMAVVADAALDGLSSEKQAIARRVFLRLIQFGEGRGDTRRRQPLEAVNSADDRPEDFTHVLGRLVKSRLVVVDQVRMGLKDATVLDLAHEALITGWPRLKEWVEEHRNAEKQRRLLEAKAQEWEEYNRQGGLLDEVGLSKAEEWLSGEGSKMGPSTAVRALVEASRQAIAARQKAEEELTKTEKQQDVRARGLQSLKRTAQGLLFLAVAGILLKLVLNPDPPFNDWSIIKYLRKQLGLTERVEHDFDPKKFKLDIEKKGGRRQRKDKVNDDGPRLLAGRARRGFQRGLHA
jgi:energy-coupling factor transporter ATP-binding protein EcfA2